MIQRNAAIAIQRYSLEAIVALNRALNSSIDKCSHEDFELIKRGVGLSIGKIQMELLEVINAQYPDLDDLKDK
jgi:hypothetical protein